MKKTSQSSMNIFNLHDTFWYLVIRWKTLLLITILSAVLLSLTEGLYLNRQRKTQQAEKETQPAVQHENIAEGDADIIEQPASVTVKAGEEAVFFVATSGKVSGYRWQFSKDGNSWSNLSTNTYPSAGTSTFVFQVTPTHNHYVFRCRVTFDDDTVLTSQEAMLTVTTPVEPLHELSRQDVIIGTVKYAAAGCLLGLMGGILALSVIFSLRAYPVNEPAVQRRYGKPCFGTLLNRKNSRILNWAFRNLTYQSGRKQEESARLIGARLHSILRKDQQVLVIGTVPSKTLMQVTKLVQPYMSCQAVPAGNINTDADALTAVAAGKRVVCVEQVLKSGRRDIEAELSILNSASVDCIGFILTE